MVSINSLIRNKGKWQSVQVELTLWPGLPVFQILGLPDQQIKESAHRIKSALRAQGFKFPKSRQILVNLRPNDIRKNSKGIELAVALAYLLETKQIPRREEFSAPEFYAYGELTLGGQVFSPEDAGDFFHWMSPGKLLTGGAAVPLTAPESASSRVLQVTELKELDAAPAFVAPAVAKTWQRSDAFLSFEWSDAQAKLMTLIAAGEHSTFFCGAAGVGKSSMALQVHALLGSPWAQLAINHRPLVRPHHSTPLRAMFGGGSQAGSGEVTRAHGGTLLLDEFLEFAPEVLESLREPFEEGVVRVARGGFHHEYPARALILATSNLCPCGDWLPDGQRRKVCQFSLARCRSYGNRMSGPLLDRFQMVDFVEGAAGKRAERKVPGEVLAALVDEAKEFRWRTRSQSLPNGIAPRKDFESTIAPFLRSEMLPQSWSSQRRELATLRVARTLADLDSSEQVQISHLRQALPWTYLNFASLARWD